MMMRAIANLLTSALHSLAVLHREARQELRVGSQPASTPGRKQAGPARTPGELFSHLLKAKSVGKIHSAADETLFSSTKVDLHSFAAVAVGYFSSTILSLGFIHLFYVNHFSHPLD